MQSIIQYFEHIPSLHRSLIIIGGLTLFWLLENQFPLFKFSYHKWKHAKINIFFTITTILVNFTLAASLYFSSSFATSQGIGLLNWVPEMPLWSQAVVGMLLLDLIGAYFIHFIEHKIKWMWQFHLVHHSDQSVDTTTANRHHPGESVFRLIFTCLAVLAVGAPMWLVFMYQSISAFTSQFNHANVVLPEKVDKILSMVFVTPNMHHVHHHYVLPYTDSNYGNIFSVWDHLFGTFSYKPNTEIVYGIDTHMENKEHSHIATILRVPFEKYRSHS